MFKQQKAFTLVELIVVITILAILGIIAFISLQGYSANSRDSVRISDMGNMKTSLELFYLNSGKYPDATGAYEVTFSGSTAWNQGLFGEDTFENVDRLDKIPTDPLTEQEYVYSVTNNKQEYQIAGIFESDDYVFNNGITSTNAAEKTAILRIDGTYNGKVLKVNKDNLTYVLAIPSIITSTGGTLDYIINNRMLAYNGFKNLPFNYGGGYETIGENDELLLVNELAYVVFNGDLNEFVGNSAKQIELATKLQAAYISTNISNEAGIENLVLLTGGSEHVGQVLISNNINSKVEVTVVNEGGGSVESGSGMELVYNGLVNGDIIELPFNGIVNITGIDWGDSGVNGCATTANGPVSCTYTDASLSDYVIKIDGNSEGYGAFGVDGRDKLVSVDKWGGLGLTNLDMAFNSSLNLVSVPATLPVGVTDISRIFLNNPVFNGDISGWDTSNVVSMSWLFGSATSFNGDIGGWNVSKVEDMSYMFNGADVFNQDLSLWNTSSVINMKNLFASTDIFNKNIGNWNTSNVTDMSYMFYLSDSFNQDISGWNMNKVENVRYMFYNNLVFNQDLSIWDTKTSLITTCNSFDSGTSSWTLTKPIFNSGCTY